jgi:hypothetical protein
MLQSSKHATRRLKRPPPKELTQSLNRKSSKRQRASSVSETNTPVRKHKKNSPVDSLDDDQPSSQKKMSKQKGKSRAKKRARIEEVDEVDPKPEVVAVNDDESDKASEASVN